MRRDGGTLGAALALIVLPAIVVMTSAARFHIDNRDQESLWPESASPFGYTVHVPPSYDGSKPAPLVLSFHGAALWGRGQQAISNWDAVADREGFIVAYPSGRVGHGPRVWRVVAPRRVAFRDAGYQGEVVSVDVGQTRALINMLRASYNIDPNRIYANGLSNGGGMSWLLSCNLSDRIAAVGMVGAAYTAPMDWCADKPPVPAIMFHGTRDEEALYHGGKSWVAPMVFPSIPGVARAWARRNGCSSAYVDSSIAADVVRRSWQNCNGADVVLYTVLDGGHTWPGGRHTPRWFTGRTTQSIDATATMWEFFRQHELRR